MTQEVKDSHIEREVRKGALTNSFGFIGKLAGPIFFILITRLYGPDVLGVFVTASALVETALAFLVGGFKDGALIFVARHADDEREHPVLYMALANALAWSLGLALFVTALVQAVGDPLIPSLYPSFGDRLLPMLRWMALALPLMAFERIVMGATQGLKIMKYEAFLGGTIRPILLVLTSSLFWLGSPDVRGLSLAYLTTQLLIFLIAVGIYGRELSWNELRTAIRGFRLNREVLSFALPQNLNATFDRFLTNIDVIMLGIFGFSAFEIGFYGAGALIVRELRQIKLIFSSAFAPHVPRLFKERDLDQLAHAFARTSRWIIMPLIPVLIGVALLKGDLLRIVHPDFAGPSSVFMFFLLVIPYLQGTFGLAGNVVVMTGHSRFNLLNSTLAGASNILLNLLLIPPLGLIGAAAASGATAVLKAGLELTEMTRILHVRLLVSKIYKPHIAGLIASVSVALILVTVPGADSTLLNRTGLVVVALLAYAAVLKLLDGRTQRSS